ncbi:hypothetical protein ZIOFF_001306 [Zingiber officinale]|uniref:Histidine-containing phosphotransfer protein n=1 Tax=Zingiber officinale TaxID=94328 RepID=A0A8J5IJH4_ZINOF|nr:hypothetical protein ZIOFF_001306 [Zingiber officinale]
MRLASEKPCAVDYLWAPYDLYRSSSSVLEGQFTQLQQLQDESNPEFVLEVVTLFFEDSEKLLDELTRTLDQKTVDFKKVDAHVHQLKGSSARVKNVCMAFRNYCEEMDHEGCLTCLQQLKQEYFLVKNKLETLFKLEQKIVAVVFIWATIIDAMTLGGESIDTINDNFCFRVVGDNCPLTS